MPSEPSPQCSKTCLLLTSHLCLDHPKHITKTDIHIYILIISQCMLHVFLNLKGTVQLQSSSLCTFPHHLLLNPFWVRLSCSSLCPWTRSVYDFDLLYEPQPHINIKYHGVNIVLTAGFCCSVYEVFALLWSYTSWLGVDCIFFGTIYQSHLQGSSTKTLEKGTDRLQCVTSQKSEDLRHSLSLESKRWHKKTGTFEMHMLRRCNLLLHLHWTIFHNFTKPGFNRMVRHRTLQGNQWQLCANCSVTLSSQIRWHSVAPKITGFVRLWFFLVGLP